MNKRLSKMLSLLWVGLAMGWSAATSADPVGVAATDSALPSMTTSPTGGFTGAAEIAEPVSGLKGTDQVGTRAPASMPAISTNVAAESEVEVVPVLNYAQDRSGSSLISVSLDDVPLQDVVRLFTRISGANIIATPSNLQGRVTVNLQDVEWKPALGSILDMYSMMISEKMPGSGIYSVQQKLTEPLIAEAIFLSYAAVSNVAAIVTPMVGKEGTVSPFPNANALVVRANAANLNDVRKVIQGIDVPRKQVFIEAKFLELTDDAIKDLGINWQVLQNYSLGVGNMQRSLNDTRTKTQSRSDKLNQADNRTRSDNINTRFDSNGNQYDETTTTTAEQPPGSGNFVSSTVITPTRSVSDNIGQSRSVTRDVEDSYSKTLTDIRTATLSADNFRLILSALKQLNGVSIVSNPKIIVANEETATIHIGENQPNIKGTVTPGQQGQANTTTYTLDEQKPYFEFGISLDVTPTINNESNITVRINPTLSRFVKDKVAPDNNTFPVQATKTIKTVFSLESGKTAAIGGLTETDNNDVTVKVPLLGDIPLIGKWLFTHTHKEQSQTETIIFVTVGMANPHDIQTDQGLPEEASLVQKHLAMKRATKTVDADKAAKPKAKASKLPAHPAAMNTVPEAVVEPTP